jgi:hypothetical protein
MLLMVTSIYLKLITHCIIITAEPLLEKLKLDFHSDVSMEERKEAGIKYLRTHCLDFLETAKIERQVRMEHARDAYLEKVRLREQEEAQRKMEKDELEEESRLAEESRLREEEEEEVRFNYWSNTHCHQMNFRTFCSIIYSSFTQEERRREEERAASIVTAKNERKKEEAKRREERRAAAKAAEIERKREKEAEAKRRREEEEAVGCSRTRGLSSNELSNVLLNYLLIIYTGREAPRGRKSCIHCYCQE